MDTCVELALPIESNLFIAYVTKFNPTKAFNSPHENVEVQDFTNNSVSIYVGSSYKYGSTGIAVFLIGL